VRREPARRSGAPPGPEDAATPAKEERRGHDRDAGDRADHLGGRVPPAAERRLRLADGRAELTVEQARTLGIDDLWRLAERSGWVQGWPAGYAYGFGVGVDVGAARILIHGAVPDLSPQYKAWRRRLDAEPECARRCGRCSACVRQAAVARNRAAYGSDDYPGTGVAS
jgi:hypothetical protein